MNRQFIEDRIVELQTLPFIWNLESPGPHYSLSLKMSRLKQLAFAFEFGSVDPSQAFPKTEFPEWIVKLDISLNELKELPPEAFFAFEHLAELDASLNALGSTTGIEVLPNLVVLDLSYNSLEEMKALRNCPRLSVVHMSHNRLRSLNDAPLLTNLTQLHLSSNKLKSLDGIQNFPHLYELYIQKNCISSLLPLAASLPLNILDASSNNIGGLPNALHVLRSLRRLKHLTLKNNPVAQDSRYATAIKESTSVEILDGMFLRDPSCLSILPLPLWPLVCESASKSTDVAPRKEDLEKVAQRVFSVKLEQKKKDVAEAIHHFHSRIMELQEELIEYEEELRLEMEGCLRYIQTLLLGDSQDLGKPWEIAEAMDKYLFTKFWEKWQQGRRKPVRFPYKELTKPEEVVKAAASLLSNPPSGFPTSP